MFQAITVKYLSPTNTKGARIKAICAGGSLTVPFDYSLNTEERHKQVAIALMEKMNWQGYDLVGGVDYQNNSVFVLINKG